MWPFSPSYLPIVNEKRSKQKDALNRANPSSASDSELQRFTNATATEIVYYIEHGEWTASQVVEAYINRAVKVHEITNCLTEGWFFRGLGRKIMFDWAREQAKNLDDEFSSTKKLRGPLHGVPASFKDQFDIIGYDSTIGFTQWANNPATTNAELVAQFLAAGAVIFVKTNVPQTMLAFECSNPLWGRTTNPHNNKYTCGGSSGGEAALLAMDGSAIGIGSDIGGSLRIPAAYCGIYSLKPSTGRISNAGARGPVKGFEGIRTVVGPMGRSVDDLRLVSRTVFGVHENEQNVAPIPYREVELPPKLCFGYYTSGLLLRCNSSRVKQLTTFSMADDYIKASPACQRAVLETVEALRREGHECIEFKVPDAPVAFNIFAGLTAADGYRELLSHLGPDPKESSIWLATTSPQLPSFIRTILAWGMQSILGDAIFANNIRSTRVRTVAEYTALVAERNAFIKMFHTEVWNKYGFDGVIAPVQAVPQLPNGGCYRFSPLAAATILYNVLDYPAGCVPVTHVDPSKDQITQEWITEPGHGSSFLENGVYHSKTPIYDPVQSAGMPIGIQIVGKKWEEEKVLAMMQVVDDALGKERGFGPGSCKT
ncbi:hypothetical protein H0H92_013570 [Tricholoma furcatifolium]|nr:hypothetical protein H0H92_013570 [Tricholoma furcatifolium]